MLTAVAEVEAIEKRYERRRTVGCANRYSLLDPYVLLSEQEKDIAIARQMHQAGLANSVGQISLMEIGCGNGNNLLRFLRLGFQPAKLVGNELLPDRLHAARTLLPSSVRLLAGDATTLDLADEKFDVVCLFTVLSSILDDDFQEQLATKAWSLVKPGGGLLCYDFIYNNPSNGDVRGVPIRRLRDIFPHANCLIRRLTLAPPLGRPIARWWPAGYSILNRLPFLRSHVLAWLQKDA